MKENKLLAQIAKFGIVGVICFVIDYAVYLALKLLMEATGIASRLPYYIYVALALSFCVSVAANYLLSMRFVFKRRQDISRSREVTVFLILSVIGLGVNELCMYIGLDVIYANWAFLRRIMPQDIAENFFFKFGATGVVMVYNFITRKIFIEGKQPA